MEISGLWNWIFNFSVPVFKFIAIVLAVLMLYAAVQKLLDLLAKIAGSRYAGIPVAWCQARLVGWSRTLYRKGHIRLAWRLAKLSGDQRYIDSFVAYLHFSLQECLDRIERARWRTMDEADLFCLTAAISNAIIAEHEGGSRDQEFVELAIIAQDLNLPRSLAELARVIRMPAWQAMLRAKVKKDERQ